MKYSRKKFVPLLWEFNENEKTDDNPSSFICYYIEGIWDKYGLHYSTYDMDNSTEIVHRKDKKYSKPPYSFNNFNEMMKKMEIYAKAIETVEDMGNIRKEAIYLILDLDSNGNLRSDPMDFKGYVSKRGTLFTITSDGNYDGKKTFIIEDEDRNLIFPDIGKAAEYIYKNYGWWACSHYLKNH